MPDTQVGGEKAGTTTSLCLVGLMTESTDGEKNGNTEGICRKNFPTVSLMRISALADGFNQDQNLGPYTTVPDLMELLAWLAKSAARTASAYSCDCIACLYYADLVIRLTHSSLQNVEQDREERHDVADSHKDVVAELSAILAQYAKTEVSVNASGLCPTEYGIHSDPRCAEAAAKIQPPFWVPWL